MKPIRRYVKARLHRRIFAWFGLSIIVTIASVAGLVAMSSKRAPWKQDIARAERFLGNQLAPVWQTPKERDRLLAGMARDFDATVIAYDATGQRIGGRGDECRHPTLRIAVPASSTENGASAGFGAMTPKPTAVGRVEVCRDRNHGPRVWLFLLITAVAGASLWLASGVIARKLIRPLGRVVKVARDIGDGKLESRVSLGCRHNADELGVLARAINDMATRIEKQMSDQRELLAAVSHELRTPLGHMRLLIEILRESSGADPASDLASDSASGSTQSKQPRRTDRLDELEREVLEVDSLVGQLLASSRLAFDTLDRRKLDAADVATRALERAGLEDSLLELELDDPHFEGDATLLARALANLLDNANSHGGGVAGLRVHANKNGQDGDDLLHFEVLDNGPGFADGEGEQVFDRFYRGAHRAGQSSLGLGLSLVDRIARAHGGRAFAKNRPEGGACVGLTVSCPRHQ